VKKRADDDDISAKNYNSVARAITKQLMIFGAGAGPRPLRPAPHLQHCLRHQPPSSTTTERTIAPPASSGG